MHFFRDLYAKLGASEEGDFPENVRRVVYVIINKRSFESFTCLDLILER